MHALRLRPLPSVSLAALFVFALSLILPRAAFAASNSDARLAIHLLPRTSKNACARATATPACDNIVTNGDLYPTLHYGYLLVTNADPATGLAGVQCGVSYNGAPHSGVDVFSWNLCATLDFQSGGWPAAGGGNLITWDTTSRCQRSEPGGPGTGVVAAAGYFYLAAYTPDALQLTVRPVDGQARVADCSSGEYTLEGGGVHHVPPVLGYASFSAGGPTPGYNPCNASPIVIDCTISGPDTVGGNSTGLVYSAPLAPPGASYLWSVSGFASIVGSSTGPTISVTAQASGDFWVAVTVSAMGSTGDCARYVTIVPPAPTCWIQGPTLVPSREPGIYYSVDASGPITSVNWTLTGNGTITGNPQSNAITVNSGDAGAFELTAVVRTSDSILPTSCTRTVTVVQPPTTCAIGGPATVAAGAIDLTYYAIPGAGQITSVAWSITGDGTITSDPAVTPVTVTAGAIGSFELSATIHITSSDEPGACSTIVTVIAPVTPNCTISGPDSASEGSPDLVYTLNPAGSYTSFTWGISGNGTITSNLALPIIHVQAGDIGAFELTATLNGPGAETHTCTKTVTLNPLTCDIQGPDPVPALQGGLVYTTGPALVGATYQWQISGNGSISGPRQGASVLVNSGSTGSFLLTVTITRNGAAHNCLRAITISGGGGHSQANAKLLVHLQPLTVKNQCGTRGTPRCEQANTTGSLYPAFYFAYLVLADGNAATGIGGLQCGVNYDPALHAGVDIFTWTLCATLEFPSGGPNGAWPASGSGNLITWDSTNSCQRFEPGGAGSGVVANAGYFYCGAYSADQLSVIPRPVDGQAIVADCNGATSVIAGNGAPPGGLSHLGSAAFSANGDMPGFNPCDGLRVPVRVTTWSAIKGLYSVPSAKAQPGKN